MKKTIIGLLVAGTLISAGTISAFAAGGSRNSVNTDGQGICSYTVNETAPASVSTRQLSSGADKNAGYIDADHDGICDNYDGSGNGTCYSDSNKDGICDNYADRDCPYNGTGNHHDGTGSHHGHHYGKNK